MSSGRAPRRRFTLLAATAVAGVLVLSACGGGTKAGGGGNTNFVTGSGGISTVAKGDRTDAPKLDGTSLDGKALDVTDYKGKVVVLNFWYAGCPPCRLEAPTLASLSEEYDDVAFLGVNTRDYADQARIFEQEYGIAYPSILDVDSASVQLAFAGSVAPNAVPTTLVLDRDGRVAARISGVIEAESILAAMIDRVLAEEG